MIEYYKETMLSYCLKCRKNTERINPQVSKTSSGKTMILLKCAINQNLYVLLLKENKQKDY